MSKLPEFGPGQVRLLWKCGSYDGMSSAVAIIERVGPAYLHAFELGFERYAKPWQGLDNMMRQLLDDDDRMNIWDRLERKYGDQMTETTDRVFNVHALSSSEFDSMLEEHRRWQLHAGLGGDYWYGNDGKPRLGDPTYWEVPRSYLDAHYYKQSAWPERRDRLVACPIVGSVTRTNLCSASEIRVPKSVDPRSNELKIYQVTWREGDPVRMEW